MKEATNYEAACEIREAILHVVEALAAYEPRLDQLRLSQMGRRDHFAGALFAELVAHETASGSPDPVAKAKVMKLLARQAWELADALDQADPLRKSKVTSSAEGAEE